MRGSRPSLGCLLGLLCAGCGGGDTTLDLTLHFDPSITDDALARITQLDITSSGDEVYHQTLSLDHVLGRTERMLYRPLSTTRTFLLSITALDDAQATLGAVSQSVSSSAGHATPVDLVLAVGSPMPDLSPGPDLASSYAQVVLNDAPIAYYRLDEPSGETVAHDSSGHGHDGTYGSAVLRVSTGLLTSEPANGAVDFPGASWAASSIITVPRDAGLEPASAVSLECWVQARSLPDGVSPIASYGPDAAPYESYVIQVKSGTFTSFTATTVGPAAATLPTAPALMTTNHLVLVFDGTMQYLYVNGALAKQANQSGTILYDGTSGFSIGSSGTSAVGGHLLFDGVIDEVAIYDAALSSAQIQRHYQAGTH
jgi:hypothetical protein